MGSLSVLIYGIIAVPVIRVNHTRKCSHSVKCHGSYVFAIQTPGTADAVPSHSEVNGTLRMLKLHFSVLFKEDIPFYIAIVNRLHLKKFSYSCSGLIDFVIECLQKIEALQPEELAKPFNSFLERYCFFCCR